MLSNVKVICSNLRSPSDAERIISQGTIIAGVGRKGDLVLCKSQSSQGAIKIVESQSMENVTIQEGDRFIGVLTTRDSSRSVVGIIPQEGLKIPCESSLIGEGGNVGVEISSHPVLGKSMPVFVEGLVSLDGQKPANIRDLQKLQSGEFSKPVIVVVGTSAECGKTTAARKMISLLSKGLKIGAAKLTGTGRLRDIKALENAGAVKALDFVDAGLPSTFTSDAKVVESAQGILHSLSKESDLVIAEMGGDVIWCGNPAILDHQPIRKNIAGVILSASDSLGALGAINFLRQRGFSDFAIVGPACNSPARAKRVELYTGVETFDLNSGEESQRLASKIGKWVEAKNLETRGKLIDEGGLQWD